ncbi:peroxide stress YaaA domain containing protein [Nitzschia inconspicua]|uniref:Peroxide stress YaaA domain containing protein n=1 Tax=Nitzschia inconspicua TaxID=303405 RepID=A0A9K3Q6B0_9STRA|nr:peroxide stress YaaA domain containing protein [Nitzschia inconspicua]
MVAILSPAKTLNLDVLEKDKPICWTKPSCDADKRRQVVQAMQKNAQTPATFRKILNVSAALAETAKQYWMDMDLNGRKNHRSKPCIYAFDGVAYKGLDIQMLSKSSVTFLQDHLRIVDPLYGWLRPMDAIEPYRLEMASRGVFGDGKSKNERGKGLAEFWKPAIRTSIEREQSEIEKTRGSNSQIMIVNLASDEYSGAVEWHTSQVVKVVFRHAGRVVPVHAKRARGLMVRYMAEHKIQTLDDLTKFDLEGYIFQSGESSPVPFNTSSDIDSSPVLVFDRSVESAPASKKKK